MTPLLQTKQGPNSIAPRIQLKENRIARSMPRIPIPYTFKEALRIDGAQKRRRERNRLQDSCRALCQVAFDRVSPFLHLLPFWYNGACESAHFTY